jgi:endonuclease YncB( thermonuclease family)
MRTIARAALLLLTLVALQTGAARLDGRIVGISDGDTVTLLTDEHRQYKVRLSGIDAPEKGQAFGARAKETLSRLVYDREVSVEWTKTDRYGRIVGKIERDGVDMNLEQLRKGSAWVYTQYLRELSPADRPLYLEAEQEARVRHAGLWHDAHPEPPWQWRRERRSHSRAGG